MPQLYAPELMKKLKLLMGHAGYKNLAEVAAEMEVKEPTLRSWTVHRDVRTAGTISKKGREPVIKFFCAHLSHLSEQAVVDLLEGPYDDMEAAFFAQHFQSLAQYISREATFEGAKLIIELDDASPVAQELRQFKERQKEHAKRSARLIATVRVVGGIYPKEFVPLGVDFRFEFPLARRAKYYLGLQQSPQGWGVFSAGPVKRGKVVHMPATLENGEPNVMTESHDHGPSRFTLIQSMQPFPDFLHINLRDGIPLSRTDVGFLTRHLQNIPKADRTLTAIDVKFIPS
ncbi:MAG: hypothetical protein ABJO27_09945 [Pseudoruegeria sp.]